jgi:enamine deaminase RidA (YjgF/YER057c/UK114 family)
MAGPVRIFPSRGHARGVALAVPCRPRPRSSRRNSRIPGDIGAQLTQALDNLETVLAQAGSDLAHVVRLNYYTTDVDALLGVWPLIVQRLADNRPASTLLGVSRLAFPEMLIEIEATALVP